MKVLVLASGSKGNCTYLEIGSSRFLIDAGISMRQLTARLHVRGKTLESLDGVFLTHEHGDHTQGLSTLAKKFGMPIYLTEGTLRNLGSIARTGVDPSLFQVIVGGKPIGFSSFRVLPFETYHDALEPCGYRFEEEGRSLVYMTDTGYFPESRFDILRNADVYIMESNHETELLLESDRPWSLKKRILDDTGHLSNEDSAQLVLNVLGEQTKTIVLAHLSEECNTSEHALHSFRRLFLEQGLILENYRILVAMQHEPMEEIEF